MEYEFTNGTQTQQQLWREGARHLLNLPADDIPLKIVVTFQDSLAGGHTDLAVTTWTYGSAEATTAVRSDAPSFGSSQQTMEAEAAALGIPYSIEKFYIESSTHELGHALYASLPEERRIAIARMFGAKGDELEELAPPGSKWQDRIIEAIAETFKEAFLPRRFRVFPARTTHKLSYSQFAEFRALWRLAIPEISVAGEPLGPGEIEVPAYNLDIYAQGEPMREFFERGLRGNFQPGAGGKDGLWETSKANNVSTLNTEHPIVHQGDLITESNFEAWVLDGTVITSLLHVPDTVFDPAVIGPPYKVTEKEALAAGESPILAGFYDSGYQWRILMRKKLSAEYEALVNEAEWLKDLMTQKEAEEFGFDMSKNEFASPNWHMFGEAAGGGPPPVDFTRAITVNSFFSETRTCHKKLYRRVALLFELNAHFALWYPETNAEAERLRALTVYQFIPSLIFKQPACSSSSGPSGVPIILPVSNVQPIGAGSAARPHVRPVAGNLS